VTLNVDGFLKFLAQPSDHPIHSVAAGLHVHSWLACTPVLLPVQNADRSVALTTTLFNPVFGEF
jgi:hypothetical protein